MRPGISEKLLVLLVMPLVAIAVLALWQLRVSLGDAALLQLKGQMLQLVQRYAAEVATQLEQAVVIADSTADILAVNPTHDPEKLFSLLEHNLDRLSIIYGSAVAFEPGEFPGKRLYSPYVYRGENRSKARMDIAVDGYDYTEPEWQWWNAPRNERRGTWTDPYFDEGAGNILMVTYSAPILDQQRFIGVATVDIDLAALHANLNLEGLRDSDYVILTRTGFFAYHYRKEMIGQSFTRLIDKLGLESSAYIERQMLAGESGFFEYAHDGTTDWVFYAPVGHLGWSFAVRVNLDDALQLAKMDAKPVYLWTVVIAVAALLLTWLAARMLLVSPLQQLRAGIDGLRAGAAPQLPQQLGSRQLDDLRDTLEASVTEVRQSAAEQAQQIESLNGMLVDKTFQLKVAQKRQDAMLDAARNATFVLDRAGQVLATNDKAETMLGRHRDEIVDASLSRWVASEQRSDFIAGLEAMFNRMEAQTLRGMQLGVDGDVLTTVTVVFTPIYLPDGTLEADVIFVTGQTT